MHYASWPGKKLLWGYQELLHWKYFAYISALKIRNIGWFEKKGCQVFRMLLSWYTDMLKSNASFVWRSWAPIFTLCLFTTRASLSFGNCAALVRKRLSKIHFKISLRLASSGIKMDFPPSSFLPLLTEMCWMSLFTSTCLLPGQIRCSACLSTCHSRCRILWSVYHGRPIHSTFNFQCEKKMVLL